VSPPKHHAAAGSGIWRRPDCPGARHGRKIHSDGLLDDLASQITAAGISVVPQPPPKTGLVIVAADPEHRVLDAAPAAGHPADVVGIRFTSAGDGKPGLTATLAYAQS
jgi:hypothetical protein